MALSRARLGLYIFGRRSVFESVPELRPAFELLFQRPDKLQLATGEMFPTERQVEDDVQRSEMDGVEHLGQYVYEMTQAKVKAMREEGKQLPQLDEQVYVGEDDDEDDVGVKPEDGVGDDGEEEEGDEPGFIPLEGAGEEPEPEV